MRAAFWALLFFLISPAAVAEMRSVSRSEWVISNHEVTVRMVIPTDQARYLGSPGLPLPTHEQLSAYVLSHIGVQASGVDCEAIDQGYDLGRINSLAVGTALSGFEIIFHCADASRPVLKNSVLFERTPQHIDYARIEFDGSVTRQVFTAGHQQIDLGNASQPVMSIVYARLGASHIAHSWPRMCFVLGLLLLVRHRGDMLLGTAGLLCGYLAALSLHAAALVPAMPLLESLMGLLVALCAAQWVAQRIGSSRWPAVALAAVLVLLGIAAGRLNGEFAWTIYGAALFSGCWLLLTSSWPRPALFVLPLLFSLLDGLVLWGDYSRLMLWRDLATTALLAFNAGALLMELGIMAVLYGGVVWWKRSRGRTAFNSVAGDLAATALAGLGAFWLVIQLKS
jgi:hypothetical protein